MHRRLCLVAIAATVILVVTVSTAAGIEAADSVKAGGATSGEIAISDVQSADYDLDGVSENVQLWMKLDASQPRNVHEGYVVKPKPRLPVGTCLVGYKDVSSGTWLESVADPKFASVSGPISYLVLDARADSMSFTIDYPHSSTTWRVEDGGKGYLSDGLWELRTSSDGSSYWYRWPLFAGDVTIR